jgi:hypothetical protein
LAVFGTFLPRARVRDVIKAAAVYNYRTVIVPMVRPVWRVNEGSARASVKPRRVAIGGVKIGRPPAVLSFRDITPALLSILPDFCNKADLLLQRAVERVYSV